MRVSPARTITVEQVHERCWEIHRRGVVDVGSKGHRPVAAVRWVGDN